MEKISVPAVTVSVADAKSTSEFPPFKLAAPPVHEVIAEGEGQTVNALGHLKLHSKRVEKMWNTLETSGEDLKYTRNECKNTSILRQKPYPGQLQSS